MQYILSQYERYKVTDQQLCKAQEEMTSLANTYLCYLQSMRRTAEIREVYKGKGERSVKETADMVGFKLPHDPKYVIDIDARLTNDCGVGQFQIPGLNKCHDYLNCSDLNNIKLGKRIGIGSTKIVHLAEWNGVNVALSQLVNKNFTADFHHGLEMLEKYNPSRYVVKLIGFCKKAHVLLTEYHKLGNATSILSLIDKEFGKNNVIVRLKLCLNYAHILQLLHDGPAGTRVMCDSNDLPKLLSQMLITNDYDLVLNDLDALPIVDKNSGIKVICGSKELFGDFVAPEQRWPFGGSFKLAAMPSYDEKTDIWKAADVFKYFISNIDASYDWVQYRLFNLFKSCKSLDPNLRPSARYLVSVLEKIVAEVSLLKTEL
ncbi:Protein O-mannose kinase [Frankliniella fusca]|uniref:Protein O-mannose kinase n=1 Tax=Frankliniella fusca TaxID=407009 RepID=A0AAE1LMQ9_9NEOP|nr:Protein O-mannose kinase [Frankliniella fusca]